MTYQNIIAEKRGAVGVITLNRPKALNAISRELAHEMALAIVAFEADDEIGCLILTGSERAFAAGADINEFRPKTAISSYLDDPIACWEHVQNCRKPIIAAVAGYALGGGCEIAMMCDFIIAADNAKFGQPETQIGILPGAGGSQRLTRLVGKSKAMDMILTGRQMDAAEAERSGLASRVVPLADLMTETLKAAEKIACLSRPAILMAKEAVNATYESTLSEGIRLERRLFQLSFASDDRQEGMAAFAEKRPAVFKNS